MPRRKKRIRSSNKTTHQLQHKKSQILTTNQGVKISDNQNSLRAGKRGPTLLEDFIFREKITHFDHERIPERVVHARGEAAHGYFELYESMARYTKAHFLCHVKHKTPVFVRFSTVAGSRGSADTVRDVRGFAVKFYTEEGNFDLVGNNIPVFFIQDAIKFPDLIHAVKPEPQHEMPQGATAHDTFWDFISVMPESMHMVMWIMSDRTIPRSLRMMEGFGVHTFKLINAKGDCHLVKFHWKPLLGVHSLMWDESQKIAGKDSDFHRRDLWDAIKNGQYPEWELGVQIFKEGDQHKFDIDVLDATKIIPEELIPVKRIGKLVLNRNPDNFFAETEQAAFHPGHIVPGIDFSDDPLLQGRLFSYLDTQISRLGGPNFHELPINRPHCPFLNTQRDAMHRQTVDIGNIAYEPNTLAAGFPKEALVKQGGFETYAQKVPGEKMRVRSQTFADHYSQATLFWNSQSSVEKQHIINAFTFELGNLNASSVRENVVNMLVNVSKDLAKAVANNLGVKLSATPTHKMRSKVKASKALSMANTIKNTIKSRNIAIYIENGVDNKAVKYIADHLKAKGASVFLIAKQLGKIRSSAGTSLNVDAALANKPSIFFDAIVFVNGQYNIQQLKQSAALAEFINDAYHHCKTIAVLGNAKALFTLNQLRAPGIISDLAFNSRFIKKLINAIALHRHWGR